MDLTTYLAEISREAGHWHPGSSPSHDGHDPDGLDVARYYGEFWTSAQRKASSLHEVSYRACFKPQLPRFFITAGTSEGDTVYDPFSGRGTTVIEAGLLGRRVAANDANPLSRILTRPRFFVPSEQEVMDRLKAIPFDPDAGASIDLSMFFERKTEAEIVSLRDYLLAREKEGTDDHIDSWIRMVATTRLTGHSPGFFSVYTLPPNQAVSQARQVRINRQREQIPSYRDVRQLIRRKTSSLTRQISAADRHRMQHAGDQGLFLTGDSRHTPQIPDNSVSLTVTSPPFLDTVQYGKDNWLRCWFNGIDANEVEQNLTITRSLETWCSAMAATFRELFRITVAGGHVAFEVGEVRGGHLRLDEHVLPLGLAAGFSPLGVLVNLQHFTKTSHIWGIGNNTTGTNTNRIVVFRKGE
ncbi:dna modification methylase [hydrocarbon metagenome]|uniref:site-specific DNA-methyltransferase (cytosine-N(4)-specific) n=1 Tax=hydrocarbon metagenome TaxID=938273 RepID=A0A0W8F4A4_9ZZZZ